MAQRKFAVFDIDGTLIRWQLYHAVVDELARAGHIDAEQFKAVRAARMNWKQRAHEAAFTGRKQPLRRERKAELLSQLMQKHGVGRAGSIGIGDSDSDIPLLELVERPIAFNPNKTLFQHARTQGWRVVIERKNMIYELAPKDGEYILTQSNG